LTTAATTDHPVHFVAIPPRRPGPASRAYRPRRGTSPRRSPAEITTLVRLAASGDQHAWNALVDDFTGLIWAVAGAHRLHDADAADVVQATWLRLLEHIGELTDPPRVGAWLVTTARRECLRVLRSGERLVPVGDDAPEFESSWSLPGEALLTHERDRALWRSFFRLRASDQALLRLLVAEPRPSYEEIAAALGIAIGSIGPTRRRALERLRQELAGVGTLSLMSV
jgi:RNA polymerase sigma factor (sigma-70 family)